MMTTRLPVLGTALLLGCTGCGATIAGVLGTVAATQGGGGGGGAFVMNAPPAVSLAAVPSPIAGDVALVVTLIDNESDATSIEVRVSVDGGASLLPGEAAEALLPAHEGKTGLAASPAGTAHVFVWNSFADLGAQNLDSVLLEVTPRSAATGERGVPARTPAFALRNRYMTTIAGGLVNPDLGDRSLPIDATVDVDGAGRVRAVYFSDVGLHQVLRLDAGTGGIGVVAGTGLPGFNGDNIPAAAAQLNAPRTIVLEANGDLLIADSGNHRIRRVAATTGFITTIAGNGAPDDTGDGGLATAASLTAPVGIALDARGNLYIGDTDNLRIRVVNRESLPIAFGQGPLGMPIVVAPNVIDTLEDLRGIASSGTGTEVEIPAILNVNERFGPTALVVRGLPGTPPDGADSTLEIVFTDTPSNRVFLREADGDLVVVAGGVAGEQLFAPASVAFESATALSPILIADVGRHRVVRKVLGVPGLTVVAGMTDKAGFAGDGGPAGEANLNLPIGIAFAPSSGLLAIADTFNRRLRGANLGAGPLAIGGKTLAPGAIDTLVSLPTADQGAPPVSPTGVAAAPGGSFFYADAAAGRVIRVDGATRFETVVASDLAGPVGIAVDGTLGRLYVAESAGDRVRRVDLATGEVEPFAGTGAPGFSGDGGAATLATLRSPRAVAVSAAGDVFIADSGNHCVRRVSPGGTISTFVNQNPPDEEMDGLPDGAFNGDGPAAATFLDAPTALLVDEAAARLLIADSGNHRVREVPLAGGMVRTIVNDNDDGDPDEPEPLGGYNGDNIAPALALLDAPVGLAIVGGDLFIADLRDHRIRVVRDGLIRTAAGVGTAGFNGDAIPPENASISAPLGISGDDALGIVIFADSGNLLVRRFSVPLPP